ncbi:MAG: nucleotidyltransferase family protein, partial [Oscillospiraceae bacterium]|nr:nucleotidyltransferase family protein [Oscillospiraceae bacterium]
AALPDASEGLWRRLMAAGRREASLDNVLSSVKSKRYALSRIRRMVTAAALGITAEAQRGLPPYIRVLGCNERGRKVLRLARTAAKLPIITKPATAKLLDPEAREIFDIDVRATDLFRLALNDPENRLGGTEWTYGPVIM